jgi:hypothetical protein
VLSPDGNNLVFAGISEAKQMLFVRAMDSGAVKALPGTDGGKFPFWSSDSKSIGFFADQQLKRLDLSGGPPMNLARAVDARGGSWAGDTIIFTPYIYEAVYRISASGGKPVAVTTIDHVQHSTHRWPHFLPDGKHFLYLAGHHLTGNGEVYAGSIDGGSPKLVVKSKGSAFYASGHLLYFRDGSLMAQEFDTANLELKGDARPIGPVLHETGNWGVIASTSMNGVLPFSGPGRSEISNLLVRPKRARTWRVTHRGTITGFAAVTRRDSRCDRCFRWSQRACRRLQFENGGANQADLWRRGLVFGVVAGRQTDCLFRAKSGE